MEAKEPKMFLPAMSPLKAVTNDELMTYTPNPFLFLLQCSLQFNYLLYFIIYIKINKKIN